MIVLRPRRSRFTKPPFGSVEVNWGHPVTNNLKSYFLLNDGGRVSNLVIPTTITSFLASWATTQRGVGLAFNGTDQRIQIAAQSNLQLSVFSKAALIIPKVDFSINRTITCTQDTASAGGGCQYRVQTTGTQQLVKSRTVNIGNSNTALTVNIAYAVGCTYDASGNFVFYLNGKPDGTGTSAQTFTHGPFQFGHNSSGGAGNDEWFAGNIIYYGEWNVVKPAAFFQFLASEPYTILRPKLAVRYFFHPAVAAAPTTAQTMPGILEMTGTGGFIGRMRR